MNNNLFILFSEIFDIYPDDNFVNKYIKDGDIDIDLILNCDFIKLNVVYTSIWNYIYNTFPTKKDFIEFLNLSSFNHDIIIENELSDNKLFQKIINSIFHLKVGALALFDNNELNSRLVKCINDIKDPKYIKDLIIEKIAYRYGVKNYDISLNFIITLMNIIKSQNFSIEINNVQYNPISGSINEFIVFSDNDLLYLNDLEKIQYIIYKDNHFIMKLIDSISFIIDTDNVDENIIRILCECYQKIHNKHILFFNTNSVTYNQIAEWYDNMYNFKLSKQIFNLLPLFCKYTITISNLMYPEVKSLSKVNQSIYYLIGDKNNKNDFILTNKYDKYVVHSNNILEEKTALIDKLNVQLEKYMIFEPIISGEEHIKNLIRSKKMYIDIWNLYIKHPCPVRSSDPRNGILLYINFIFLYFIRHAKKIEELVYSYNPNSKYCVIIVDNRPNILSIISVLFTMINLNNNWSCRFYTSSSALEFYENYLGKFVDVIDVDLLNHKFHIDIYNKLLTSVEFWESIDSQKCLIIQDDGVLIRKGIDRFLSYDYVGAPWVEGHGNEYLKKNVNSDLVGNGGFSLRTVSKMKEIVNKVSDEEKQILFYQNLNNTPEDVFFCKNLKKMNDIKMPLNRDASYFSSEEILNMDSIGFHKVWNYHHPDNIKKFFRQIILE